MAGFSLTDQRTSPTCKNDEKELQFWRTHAPSDDFVTRMRPGDPFATPKKVKTLPRR